MFPSTPHPTGVQNPITLRAAAALEAAGAWDADPTEFIVPFFRNLTLFCSYDEDAGATDGAVEFYIEYSPYSADQAGVEDWFRMSLYSSGAVASGVDSQSNIQRESVIYGATDAAAENFVYGPIALEGTIQRIRFFARESGDAANPGEFHVVGILNGE